MPRLGKYAKVGAHRQNWLMHVSNESVSANLKILSGLYTTYDLDDLRDFYFLHWAFVDLENGDDQHYWEGATKANIEDIVRKKCIQYVG